MADTYWRKQEPGKPLFPDLLWSRPQNKRLAGKLLIVGGHAQSFAAVGEAYNEAVRAGAGTIRILLPDVLNKTVGKIFTEAEFAPSTPSGSFAQTALSELIQAGDWADSVLLAGDLGRNSETAILLEKFVEKYTGQLTIAKDAADYFTTSPRPVINRPATTLVVSFAQLQKIATNAKFNKPFTFDTDILRLTENLHELSSQYQAGIITKHLENILVAVSGKVSSTKVGDSLDQWRVAAAAHAAVWYMQNPSKQFAALTSAVLSDPA